MPDILTSQDLIEWISYYEENGDHLPDPVMTSILYMAQLYAEQVAIGSSFQSSLQEGSNKTTACKGN